MSIAVVTGSGRGLGEALGDRLGRDGCDLVLVGRDHDGLERVAAAARDRGIAAEVLVADLGDPDERVVVENRLAGSTTASGPTPAPAPDAQRFHRHEPATGCQPVA